jgi:hypothetical protein
MQRNEFVKVIEYAQAYLKSAGCEFEKGLQTTYYNDMQLEYDCRMYDAAHSLKRASEILAKAAADIVGNTNGK